MNYIGIDIGDGESCVCVLPEDSQIQPRPIKVTGRESFLSAVAGDTNDEPIIGMDAVKASTSKGFSVRFKSRFLSDSGKAQEDMRRFLTGLHTILEKDGVFKTPFEVAVGCPAGWQNEARRKYTEMVQSAGFQSPHIVSESRAAFLYAKNARTIQMNPALIESSALVIDIGSSTLDFAYVVDGCESNVGTFGDVYLGGGAIDEALLQAAVNESSHKAAIRKVFEEAPEWRSHCLLAARQLKEEYFTRQSGGEKNIQVSSLITLFYDDPLPLKLHANEQLIWRVVNLNIDTLGGISFYKMLKKALDFAFEQTKERPPKLVLLTGGASRMLFFQEMCRERFPQATFVLCNEPEYSIARGLAYSIRVDRNIQAFNTAIQQYIQETSIHNAVNRHETNLIEKITEFMAEVGIQEAREHLFDWANGKYKTLSELNHNIQQDIVSSLNSAASRKTILNLISNEMNGICTGLQPQIDDICKAYGVPCGVMQLQDIELSSDVAPSTNVKVDIDFLRKSVQLFITGAVALILLQIPGLQIIEMLLAALAATAGKDLIESMTEKAEIPLWIRSKMPINRFINEKVKTKMYNAFIKELSATSAFQDDVSANMEKLIVNYVSSMARDYEIRITGSKD